MPQPDIDALGLRPRTNNIAYRMFFDTADLNYIGARQAFLSGRDLDFFWLSLHALEKYLKATLLVNGRPARNYGHSLIDLFAAVEAIDARLKPPSFADPTDLANKGRDREFLERLDEIGGADSRYGTYSYVLTMSDLYRVDQLNYWARRFAVPVTLQFNGHSWVDELLLSPSQWFRAQGPLERVARLSYRNPNRWPLTRFNYAFFPKLRHRPPRFRTSTMNAAIGMECDDLRRTAPGTSERSNARAIIEWTIENIRLHRDDVRELKALLQQFP